MHERRGAHEGGAHERGEYGCCSYNSQPLEFLLLTVSGYTNYKMFTSIVGEMCGGSYNR